jgi:hypothetical protein
LVHQRPILGRRARAHFGKRAVIEHARDGIAGFDHDEADRARLEIAAILAGSKSGHRSARNGSQGTIEGTHNCAHTNLMRRSCESVASAFAFLGVNETGVSEVGQNMIQKLFRNRIRMGDIRDLRQFVGLKSGQVDHGLESVLSFLREHNLILTLEGEALVRRGAPKKARALVLI